MYLTTLKLQHNEVPAKINAETGEVTQIKQRVNNIPAGKVYVRQTNFSKVNTKTIKFLSEMLSNLELAIVFKMIGLADFDTNSMKPLSNDTTVRELADQFGIGINTVTKSFKRLFDLGVYAQFKIAKDGLKEYWILNPYISFKGKFGDDSIWTNFKSTEIEKVFNSLTD